MTRTSLPAVALLALFATAACHPKSLAQAKHEMIHGGVHISTSEKLSEPVTVATKLDCPEQQGALRRTSRAPDGRACAYASDKGVVELALLPGGAADPHAALAPMKARLDAMLPREANGGTVAVSSETGADGREHANVDMPFLHVRDDGKRSHVRILGMTIDSDDKDEKPAKVVSASSGTESVYVLAGDPGSADGYHAVGFVARGAASGGLLVGTFKYRKGDAFNLRTGDDHAGDQHTHDGDLDALMDLNAPKG